MADSVMLSNKHLDNLCFRVCEKLGERVRFVPVVLDPNTANGWLRVSDDLTSVRHANKKQQLPDNLERFSKCPTVLGYEGFSSGTHSWTVEVGDHPDWSIGVAKETVDRKREPCVTPEHGFWCLTYKSGTYTNGCGETITLQKIDSGRIYSITPNKITVKLDYDGGLVSFYDAEDMTHIYTHKSTFTEKLHAFFLIGKPGDAKTTDIKLS